MRSVFRDKITGDGGDIGVQLMQDLNKAIRKYTFDEPREAAAAVVETAEATTPKAGADRIAAPRPRTGS